MMQLDNSFKRLSPVFHSVVDPEPAAEPRLIAWNAALAESLGLEELAGDEAALARTFSGGPLPDGFEPVALAYAGHQFGMFVPALGDGRAALLGEVVGRDGRRYDIQLKGSGRTPYSRGGDGRSWLGPVIREYVVSEAMHHLGIPTTRALAAVATGERVYRDAPLPGAVFTRVAASHLRVGTFEYFAARKDTTALETLTDYAIDRHYPEAQQSDAPYVAFLDAVSERQAELVAQWMAAGFIHGVMNTDNTSIAGETLDYGPCAFMDEFRYDKVFSSIDQYGRYAYANQAPIAQWNLSRLAECLLLLCDDREGFETVLSRFPSRYNELYLRRMRAKLGMAGERDGDDALVAEWLGHLQENELDYTLAFRELAERAGADDDAAFGPFESGWRERVLGDGTAPELVAARMNAVNPLFIPRNHRIEEAIHAAVDGDYTTFRELNTVLARPFDEQPELARYAEAPLPAERVTRTFCGT